MSTLTRPKPVPVSLGRTWDLRALVLYLFIAAVACIAVTLIDTMHHQVSDLRHQLDVTNTHLVMIERQVCLDANANTRTFIAQVNPDPAPTLRTCP